MDAGTRQSATVTTEALRARVTEAYARQSRETLEEKWILDSLPLVRHIVLKIISGLAVKMDEEDLISAGTLGLVRAARAYDQSRDAVFQTYAYIRIRGAVIDELRSRSFVPSAVYKQIKAVSEAYRRHVAIHGSAPSDEELAGSVGIDTQQLYKTLEEARRQHFLSIHGLGDESSPLQALVPPDGSPSPQEQAERAEMLERLGQAIRNLPKRDRLILLLYYERDLTMKETSKVLGVTESRVSQLHASALFKLSMKLKEF